MGQRFESLRLNHRFYRYVCLHRLVVRTPGFHPGNGGSIPPGDALDHLAFARWSFFCEQSSWNQKIPPILLLNAYKKIPGVSLILIFMCCFLLGLLEMKNVCKKKKIINTSQMLFIFHAVFFLSKEMFALKFLELRPGIDGSSWVNAKYFGCKGLFLSDWKNLIK